MTTTFSLNCVKIFPEVFFQKLKNCKKKKDDILTLTKMSLSVEKKKKTQDLFTNT